MDYQEFADKCLSRAFELLDEGPKRAELAGEILDESMCVARSEALMSLCAHALNVGGYEVHRTTYEAGVQKRTSDANHYTPFHA